MTPAGFVLSIILAQVAQAAVDIIPGSLRTNGLVNPLGTGITTPVLNWQLSSSTNGVTQAGYRLIASHISESSQSTPLWDTGSVSSNISTARWAGPTLASRERVYWQIQAWDDQGSTTPWSEPAWFEMGLLSDSDWGSASWIENSAYVSSSGNTSLPMFAVDFEVGCSSVVAARLYLCGLGIHVPSINGQTVGTEVLAPGYSTFNTSVEYSTYDVTKLLTSGANTLGVELGRGVWDVNTPLGGRYQDRGVTHPATLKLISVLEYVCTNNTEGQRRVVASSPAWKTSGDGPYLESAWWGGEEYDARKEIDGWNKPGFDRSSWTSAATSPSPGGNLIPRDAPPIEVVGDPIAPVSLGDIGNGSYVFDMGVNFAGWYEITMTGQRGQVVTISPGERQSSSGNVSQCAAGCPVFDRYTFKDNGTVVHRPKFRYQGFRYLQVDNLAVAPAMSDVKGLVLRAANTAVGTFNTSDTLLQEIHGLVDRAIQSNMYSTLTDCPTRERMGWLEQDHLVYSPVRHGYDIDAYTKSMVKKMADAQHRPDFDGLVPVMAPAYVNSTVQDINWGGALVLVPLEHYHAYGDQQLMVDYYDDMVRYMGWIADSVDSNYALTVNSRGFGDWEATDATTPKNVTEVWGYQRVATAMAEIAELVGKDSAPWAALARNITHAFNSTFLNTSSGSVTYSSGSQASDVLAFDIGAVPEDLHDDVLAHLVASIEAASNHSTVGEIALPAWFSVLADAGRNDLIYEWLKKTDQPSYGNFVATGATALPETWDRSASDNHFMLGIVDKWLVETLVGLQQRKGSVSFRDLVIKPTVIGDVTSASATHVAKHGMIGISWVRNGEEFSVDVVVPVGSRAEVFIPATDVSESGMLLQGGANGVRRVTLVGDLTVVNVGSGRYRFAGTFVNV